MRALTAMCITVLVVACVPDRVADAPVVEDADESLTEPHGDVEEEEVEPETTEVEEAPEPQPPTLAGSFITDDGDTVPLTDLAADVQVAGTAVYVESTEVGVFDDGSLDRTVVTWAAEACFELAEDWDRVYIDDAAGTELASASGGRCDIATTD